MLNQERVFDVLAKHGVTFFTGVPDSYLNGFCNLTLSIQQCSIHIRCDKLNPIFPHLFLSSPSHMPPIDPVFSLWYV